MKFPTQFFYFAFGIIVAKAWDYYFARTGRGQDGLIIDYVLSPEERMPENPSNIMAKENSKKASKESASDGTPTPIDVAFSVTRGFRKKLTAKPTTTKGKAATVDGGLQSRIIDGTSIDTTPVEGDPLSLWINGRAVGDTQLEVALDAKLGPEQRLVTAVFTVSVVDEEAANLGINISDEEEIPT